MKIGIVTFHRATNYGAILQAYALVSYLKSLGHEAEFIDCKSEGIASLFPPINVLSIIQKVKRLFIIIYMILSLKTI
ncbi:polysaccharide pyruvyl transferase family protein [Bacteroides fragilis]|uniref:polysaccharide pyruvyl transferase family protein n=1 Tax=Bacteroides fragilis TaxID=817 RepID=UPI00202F37C9|nr:polysaccharide pyruvyl transferase family protein [Bacteroides fragilis]MCM0343634.1 polysaccharide pyruvyl transferase family protein [Bacteroides fragilis]